MRRMYKKIVWIVCIGIIAAWTVRVVRLNSSLDRAEVETYQIGDLVDYGKNIFIRTGEERNGYQIQVRSARVIPYEQFAQEYGLELPELTEEQAMWDHRAEYVYDVEATFFNNNAAEGAGIDLTNTWMVTDCTNLVVDKTLWSLLYPNLGGSRKFAIREGTQMDFHLPYTAETAVREELITKEYLNTETFYLTISLYPVRKRIEIVNCETEQCV